VIASCSLDRTVKVWEEDEKGTALEYSIEIFEGDKSQWIERACLRDSRAGILQVAFAPAHLTLKLVKTPPKLGAAR